MDGVDLRYATAQLMTKLDSPASVTYVFVRTPGVPAEFALQQVASLSIDTSAHIHQDGDIAYLRVQPNLASPIIIRQKNGRTIRILLLTQQQAEDAWKVRLAGEDHLLLTNADLFADASHITLRSLGTPRFHFSLLPALKSPHALSAGTSLHSTSAGPGLQEFTAELPPARAVLTVSRVRPPRTAPPVAIGPALSWRKHGVAIAPTDSAFQTAAATWNLRIAWPSQPDISDLFLTVNYQGDVARLIADGHLLDDDFYNGEIWRVGLRRYRIDGAVPPLTLQILPLRGDAPIFLEPAIRAALPHTSQVDRLNAIHLTPQYQLQLNSR
jgi:beta-galactosidase